MENTSRAPAGPASQAATAPFQDHLTSAIEDLDRLQGLLSHAGESLVHRFSELQRVLEDAQPPSAGGRSTTDALSQVRRHLRGAVQALQFQDLARQHIHHIRDHLQGCANQLALQVEPQDGGGCTAMASRVAVRPSPVDQADMGSGSVELF